MDLPVRVAEHRAPLGHEPDPADLRLVAAAVDGVLVRPGETFSLARVVGRAGRRRGRGRTSYDAAARLAGHLHELVPAGSLTVVEPAVARRGGVDVVLRNDGHLTFQLRTWVDARHLRAELRTDRLGPDMLDR